MTARVSHATIRAIVCSSPSTEYPFDIPDGTTRFKMQAVDADVRVGILKSAAEKWTLKATQPQIHEKNVTGPRTFYFQSDGGGTVQIWLWS